MNLKELKELAKTPAFLAEMGDVFFEGMNTGYANNAKKGVITELPGFKLIPPYIRGPWKVTDGYHVTLLSSVSGGTTIISYEIGHTSTKLEVPVWMMQYFGQYDKAAIPCLKIALRTAYEERRFYAGRGPHFFQYEGFTYHNWIEEGEHRFDGIFFGAREEIRDQDGIIRGIHQIQGGRMC